MRFDRLGFAAAVVLTGSLGLTGRAEAQGAIGFSPVVGTIPDGASLNVTPVVSADRRYVRLSVNPQFSTIDGFNTLNLPLGAVGGSGGGGGGIGGGFRSQGLGGSVLTGMNGPIGLGGFSGESAWYDEGYYGMPTAPKRSGPRKAVASKAKAKAKVSDEPIVSSAKPAKATPAPAPRRR